MSINITGDPSKALTEIAKAQAAIDSLKGKRVTFPRLPGESDNDYPARWLEFRRKLRGDGEAA
jgi:hypothetical protein